ncbi:hypothetical protein CDL15_Pgr023808 [Punica granatum]|uniref:Uncharacterized protein n=1 Tax=Punica granatum TaxID=22663 RepID=A0A218VZA1_PUNGR|nr:hypothetical protein CDL15_Pgr023808 [Punica granatum]PKI74775.1 hypothetical protein CRG98_004793 [Punica granatum]
MRRYDTFARYYSNRVALREPESPTEDALAQTSPPHTQEMEAETAPATLMSETMEAPHDSIAEASAEVKAAQEDPSPLLHCI